jgi:quercetin dioxygenase-like cupin family protein
MAELATHYRWEDLPREQLTPTLARRLVTGEQVMLAHVYLEPGCVVQQHAHENEQVSYVLEGRLRFWLGEDGGETVDVGAGEVLHLPSNVPHKVEALEQTLVADVFAPPRRDWLDGNDDYLRR